MTLAACVAEAAGTLEAGGFPQGESRRDASLLARAALGWDEATWLVRLREPAPADFRVALDTAVRRRLRHEPVAYIVGEREFYGRSFKVTRDVLVPRPETELVVDEALRVLPDVRARLAGRPPAVLDVGTGSGCLAVTIALECPDARVVATDVSPAALDVARDNAVRLGAANRVRLEHGSLTGDAIDAFDVVVSNPPYVAERDRDMLPSDVRDYEPARALFGGPDGLEVLSALVPAAHLALTAGGWLIVEFGHDQADAVVRLAGDAGFASLRVSPDLAGIPRVMSARKARASI